MNSANVAYLTSVPFEAPLAPHSVEAEIARLRGQVAKLTEALNAQASGNFETQLVRSITSARRRRSQIFEGGLFADPAWDMLLALYDCALEQKRISISKLCKVSGVSASRALRWIGRLCDAGHARRRADPYHGKRVWIELTEQGVSCMKRYFDGFAQGPTMV